jgi:hypothetical protein
VINTLDIPTGRQRITELAAAAFSRDFSTLYFQFSRNCERKLEFSENLIRFWRDRALDLPGFDALTEAIVPSPETIDYKGPAWRD